MPESAVWTQAAILELSGAEYGIPTDRVKEIVRLVEITPVPESPDFVKGAIDYRGSAAIVLDLALRLGLENSSYNLNTQIIIVETAAGLSGLIVDRVVDVIMIDSSAVMRGHKSTLPDDITVGAYEAGERLVLLLNIDKVLDYKQKHPRKNGKR